MPTAGADQRGRQGARLGVTPLVSSSAGREITFPVVGVGAFAGGQNALRFLLRALPKNGMAFILMPHLDLTQPSMLEMLVGPDAAMPLVVAADGALVKPDHIYVVPPGRYLSLHDGALRLTSPPSGTAVRLPFDVLLTSLAEQCGEYAVAMILSQTGSDGAVGAKAINAAAGLVIAQDPDEAEYDGLSRSVIGGGAIDLMLPLAAIPEALARYGGHRYLQAVAPRASRGEGDAYAHIIDLLEERTAHDFRPYKHGTIERRIERRMALNGLVESQAYLELLKGDPAEVLNLADDLLINITRFFRDQQAFEVLADEVFPRLLQQHAPDQPFRVWVAGCSTGEEAYSISMLLLDALEKARLTFRLQIFATDLDARAIDVARNGFYPPTIAADVSPERLARFFVREEKGYRASPALRAPIVFSTHDLMRDPPFSKLDMVSCRNLLIYLRPEVQQKVLGLFHFALFEGAILFLDGSSNIGAAADRFDAISAKQHIYRHVRRSRPGEVQFPLGRREAARAVSARPDEPEEGVREGLGDLAQRLLLELYAPASVLVGPTNQIVYYFGATDSYLKMPAGDPSLDVLAAAREGLRPAIRAALERAAQQPEAVTVAGWVKREGDSRSVSVTARAMTKAGASLTLLSFVDQPQTEHAGGTLPEPKLDRSPDAGLREDLDNARKDLEVATRERDVAEEEIRAIKEEAMSVNEEFQATSEEFQATSEELQTSQEQLETLNDELTALNNQLRDALNDQRSTADDLQNILNSSDQATIFLDGELTIRFFTPAATTFFSVIATDVGRPLADLVQRFVSDDLLGGARAVLASLVPTMREVGADNGRWYNCRILPYRTKDNRIAGVVITFADISARKRAEDEAKAAALVAKSANLGKSRFLAAASHDLRQPLQTISLLNGLLEQKVKDKATLELLARGGEALTTMSGMLNTLLDINQIEAGVVRPEIVNFPIADLLESLQIEFAYHAKAKGLGWRVAPCRLAVRSDPRLLEQMIRNLLANALKYTRKGRVVLGCRRRGDTLRIEVWDTGLGIPAERLRAIFEEFHQIDNPARDLSRGLGLGLAIVQRLGDLLGHAVEVRSNVGRGSVFSIEVSLAPTEAVVLGRRSKPASVAAPSRTGMILIVEDDPALRDSLGLFSVANGHVPETAADGAAAVRRVEREGLRPDLVITDHNLPDMTGLQVLARLQATLGPALPAIVLTGDVSTSTLREIAAKGYEHRTKPASTHDLAGLIGRLLSAHPPASPTSPRLHGAAAENTIFLVDDDSAVRQSLGDLLRANGRPVEGFGSAEDFLAAYRPGTRGVLVLDVAMPGMGGLALLDRLGRDGTELPTIIITGKGDVQTAVHALRAGAADFLEKPVDGAGLLASIERAVARASASSAQPATRSAAAARLAGLTPRQRRILDLVLAGHPSKIIAADLGISQRTVDAHRATIMKRSKARSLPELIRLVVTAT